jgi:hypothetical protein
VTDFFASGRVADLVLAILLLELAALALLRRRGVGKETGRPLVPFLVAGAFFALALRAALTDVPWPWVAAALVGAFLAHVAGLAFLGPVGREERGAPGGRTDGSLE